MKKGAAGDVAAPFEGRSSLVADRREALSGFLEADISSDLRERGKGRRGNTLFESGDRLLPWIRIIGQKQVKLMARLSCIAIPLLS